MSQGATCWHSRTAAAPPCAAAGPRAGGGARPAGPRTMDAKRLRGRSSGFYLLTPKPTMERSTKKETSESPIAALAPVTSTGTAGPPLRTSLRQSALSETWPHVRFHRQRGAFARLSPGKCSSHPWPRLRGVLSAAGAPPTPARSSHQWRAGGRGHSPGYTEMRCPPSALLRGPGHGLRSALTLCC